MFCSNCGSAVSREAEFCQLCGTRQSQASSTVPDGHRDLFTAPIARSKGRLLRWTIWMLGLSAVLATIATLLDKSDVKTSNVPPSSGSSASTFGTQEPPYEGVIPHYRLYKFVTGAPTAYVVPAETSDEGLRNLLWFFRKCVRAGELKKISIRQPTVKEFGEMGYGSGMLVIYRGERCANEGYISDSQIDKGNLGPCGYGDHSAAVYQWGIDQDPAKDAGSITEKNGDVTSVFDYKDDWNPSLKGPAVIDLKKQMEWKQKQEKWEPMQHSAVTIANVLNSEGLPVHASANFDEPTELDFKSTLFKGASFRSSFIHDAIPKARSELCQVGFQSFRLIEEGVNYSEKAHPLNCK